VVLTLQLPEGRTKKNNEKIMIPDRGSKQRPLKIYVHNEVLMFIDKSKQETNILWAASALKTGLNVRLTLELENKTLVWKQVIVMGPN
jgi:hypothetical protein